MSVRYKIGVMAAILSVVALMAGCGGAPDGIISEADETATAERAEKANFKYCKIESDRMCQSPDGSVVFRLPLDLLVSASDRIVEATIKVKNESLDSVVIDNYYIMMIDNKGNSYNPNFRGPNNYDAFSKKTPAMTLRPGDEEDVYFSQQLDRLSESVKAVTIFYRLEGDEEFTQVMVSYRPQNIYQLQK
ncbi:MAG: hypothetical protein AB1483_12870 [Candidatus Zixiibacteriota bacterium]